MFSSTVGECREPGSPTISGGDEDARVFRKVGEGVCVVSAPSPSGVPHGSGGLWIGGTIRVVVSIKGNTVRLGVAARPDVIVDRAEVHAQRQEFTAVEVALV